LISTGVVEDVNFLRRHPEKPDAIGLFGVRPGASGFACKGKKVRC
jgi:hypothetical protein